MEKALIKSPWHGVMTCIHDTFYVLFTVTAELSSALLKSPSMELVFPTLEPSTPAQSMWDLAPDFQENSLIRMVRLIHCAMLSCSTCSCTCTCIIILYMQYTILLYTPCPGERKATLIYGVINKSAGDSINFRSCVIFLWCANTWCNYLTWANTCSFTLCICVIIVYIHKYFLKHKHTKSFAQNTQGEGCIATMEVFLHTICDILICVHS